MVASLGPGKFYGSALPRPRFYTEVKFSEGRVDPPASVVDPLLSWAKEAHWSMGGLSFTRLRLQGRIEGKISKLRAQKEKELKVKEKGVKRVDLKIEDEEEEEEEESEEEEEERSPPKAPAAQKRRRRRLVDESGDEGEEEEVTAENNRKKLKRKLYEEFEEVAKKTSGGRVVAEAEKGKGSVGGGGDGRRTSPGTLKNSDRGVMVRPASMKVADGKLSGCTDGRVRISPRLAKAAQGGSSGGSGRTSRRLVKSG